MQETQKSFRETVELVTGKSLFVVVVIIVSLLCSIFAGQLGALLLYMVVFTTLWARKWDWKYFGLTRSNWRIAIFKALLFTIGIFVLIDFLIQPLIEIYFGNIDLSQVSGIEGNFINYVLYVLLGWVFGGFCEEIIYRGYLLKRLAIILGDTNKAWLFAAVVASFVFGAAHSYQGFSGVMTTAIIALLFGLIFIFNKNDLLVLMLTHGIYNMVAITLIYLGKARMITDWMQEFMK